MSAKVQTLTQANAQVETQPEVHVQTQPPVQTLPQAQTLPQCQTLPQVQTLPQCQTLPQGQVEQFVIQPQVHLLTRENAQVKTKLQAQIQTQPQVQTQHQAQINQVMTQLTASTLALSASQMNVAKVTSQRNLQTPVRITTLHQASQDSSAAETSLTRPVDGLQGVVVTETFLQLAGEQIKVVMNTSGKHQPTTDIQLLLDMNETDKQIM